MSDKTQLVHRGKKEMLWNNFLGGVAWSFGIIVGTALILAILTIVANNINFVPIVGDFISDVIDYIVVTNQNMQQ